jgi:hypothetical protein
MKTRHLYRRAAPVLVVGAVVLGVLALLGPAALADGDPWEKTSEKPVARLDRPAIEDVIAGRGGVDAGFKFAVFGDQRALADGEWQELVRHIARFSETDPDLLFVLDTGDIVNNGQYSDQFHALEEILEPVSHMPYLVGVGNHEKRNNESREALRNTAAFLDYLDPAFNPDRMYYRKDIGPASFIFMDTNDLVYGDLGEGDGGAVLPGSRAESQMEWLVGELAACAGSGVGAVIVVMHHPFVQSSKKHRAQSISLWNLEFRGETLGEMFLRNGVDIVLAGHTHTFERFEISDGGGASMDLVNISGRPRGGLMWLGPLGKLWGGGVTRKAKDISGEEASWLAEEGWIIPEGWSVTQADAMLEDDADQFAIFTVEDGGGILLETAFLDEDAQDGLRWSPRVRIN